MSADAATTYRQLQHLARQRRRTTQQVLELYAHERLLARVAQSQWRHKLVLKGGMLLASLHLRDVTRDVDLLARGIDSSATSVRDVIAELAAIQLDDGVSYETTEISVDAIRDDADYQGVRVRFHDLVHTARIRVQVDLNFGDPIDGIVRTLPGMLDATADGTPGFTMITYPLEAVIAEKVVTMITRGDTNTRDRDFADIWLISRHQTINGTTLTEMVRATTDARGQQLVPLAMTLHNIATYRQTAWTRFLARTQIDELPREFADVVAATMQFADPVITGKCANATWNPDDLTWQPTST